VSGGNQSIHVPVKHLMLFAVVFVPFLVNVVLWGGHDYEPVPLREVPLAALVTLLSFGVAITVHEFGHALTAWMVGFRVESIHVGIGPALLQTKLSRTAITLHAFFALGGYTGYAYGPQIGRAHV
jgi:hypothetical protein